MRDGMRRGYTLPRVLVEEMLPLLAALGADTSANVFYQPLKSIPATVSEAERRRFTDSLTAGVRNKILPSYRTLHDFLRNDYLPRARADVGLSALPLGDEWYAFLIRRETGTALTAAELHAVGLRKSNACTADCRRCSPKTRLPATLRGVLRCHAARPAIRVRRAAESSSTSSRVQVAAALSGLFAQAAAG